MHTLSRTAFLVAVLGACSRDATSPNGTLPQSAELARGGTDVGAVFTLSNSAGGNAVIAFARSADGRLTPAGTFATQGNGTGAGLGSQGGFSFWLQDRTGGSIETLDATLQQFLTAARKRPELGTVNSPFSASVPQVFVDVDRDKVLKEGIALGDVYQTMQTFLGGLYVNQFNRFGRQWRVFLQAEGDTRRSPDQIGQFYVRNDVGTMVPLSAVQSMTPTFGPQFTNRFNVYRAVQVTGAAAPGLSSAARPANLWQHEIRQPAGDRTT